MAKGRAHSSILSSPATLLIVPRHRACTVLGKFTSLIYRPSQDEFGPRPEEKQATLWSMTVECLTTEGRKESRVEFGRDRRCAYCPRGATCLKTRHARGVLITGVDPPRMSRAVNSSEERHTPQDVLSGLYKSNVSGSKSSQSAAQMIRKRWVGM